MNILAKKNINLGTTNKTHLNCDDIDGSIVNGLRRAILISFVLNKPNGYKVFCRPETILFKRINRSVLNTLSFYLENDNSKGIDFN